ncbi:MAG: pyridoxal 5'-phosphate synthase glutaminase subunit PdxT [Actinobacteria bacterium]|uniref:glutaminase n=1 Tax=freshwater metagenome TaxID=449393 RepID=A0A6J6CYT1_9ZZZZ|nr:pyridoxal 5'-phosphate synthase glutaminase subunit PdxT [Actinomycetota bacterium]
MRIGVLALQGDVREHIAILGQLNCVPVEVRKSSDLKELSGLILPGGESTTISKLLDIFEIRNPILDFVNSGKAIFGTCAGMITLATEVLDSAAGQQSLGVMDISVRRNAFGSQLDSFEDVIDFDGAKINVAFIRAPIVEKVGGGVQVLASLEDGRVVAVRQENMLATSFHPEITGESFVHEYFLNMASSAS